MPSIHVLADVKSDDIGEDTRVWQYAVIMAGAKIGRNCNVCAHTLIEGNVAIGDNVTIKSGVYLWDGTIVGDNVFIGPNATFTNDPMPRSRLYPKKFMGVIIEEGASIGANATILPGVRVGKNAMVGAGAVVVRDVAESSVVVGNPAKVIRIIDND